MFCSLLEEFVGVDIKFLFGLFVVDSVEQKNVDDIFRKF